VNGNLSGSSITTRDYGGSGIGTGYACDDADSGIANLTIVNGNLSGRSTARERGGSGIGTGSGNGNGSKSRVENLTILNGNLSGASETSQRWGGSGIGTGGTDQPGANTGIGTLTILDGNVSGRSTAGSYGGSGIGTGCVYTSGVNSSISILAILGGNVSGTTASGISGGSGIGTGFASLGGNSAVGDLGLSGNLTLFCDSLRASRISIWNASVLFVTQGDRLFEITPNVSGAALLAILYGNRTAEPHEPLLTDFPFLSIGNINFPVEDSWRFCFSRGICSDGVFRNIHSLFTFVPDEGLYSILVEGAVRGFLGPAQGEATFRVPRNGSFVPQAYFNFINATSTPRPTPTSTPRPTPSMSSYFTGWGNQIWKHKSRVVAMRWFLFFGCSAS
jgi:hypothetical protein